MRVTTYEQISQQLFLSTPLTGRVTTTVLCHQATLASHRGWQPAAPRTVAVFPNDSSMVVQPGASASHVRDRPASTIVDRLLLARLNGPLDCPSIVGQGEATPPRAQASPDESQRRCCFFRQCLRAMPMHWSLDRVFLQPCWQASSPQRDAKRVSKGCFRQPSPG